jgi:hypothetical protein
MSYLSDRMMLYYERTFRSRLINIIAQIITARLSYAAFLFILFSHFVKLHFYKFNG